MELPIRQSPPARTGSGRIDWVDATRGAAIIAIVAFHVLRWDFLVDLDRVWEPAGGIWWAVNSALGQLRVPLLLLVSGWMSATAVSRGLGSQRTRRRITTGAYIYLVWLLIYFGFFQIVRQPLPHRFDTWPEFALQLVAPNTPLWYVYALVVYVVVTSALRRAPTWLVLVISFAVSLASLVLLPTSPQGVKIGQDWFYYVLGSRIAPTLTKVGDTARPTRWLILTVASAGIWVARRLLPDAIWLQEAYNIGLRVAMLAVAVTGMALLCRMRVFRQPLAYLGRRTLAIYLIHPFLVYLLIALGGALPALISLRENPVYAVFGPFVLITAVLAASLAFHLLTDRGAFRWLYAPPRLRRERRMSTEQRKGSDAPPRSAEDGTQPPGTGQPGALSTGSE